MLLRYSRSNTTMLSRLLTHEMIPRGNRVRLAVGFDSERTLSLPCQNLQVSQPPVAPRLCEGTKMRWVTDTYRDVSIRVRGYYAEAVFSVSSWCRERIDRNAIISLTVASRHDLLKECDEGTSQSSQEPGGWAPGSRSAGCLAKGRTRAYNHQGRWYAYITASAPERFSLGRQAR